jgi:hypothetical protein
MKTKTERRDEASGLPLYVPKKGEKMVVVRRAYVEISIASSNYANPLYLVHYPDGHTLSTMHEAKAKQEADKFNKAQRDTAQPTSLGVCIKHLEIALKGRDEARAHAERLAKAAKLGLERLEWQIACLNERGEHVAKHVIDAEEEIREALAAWEKLKSA